MGIYAWHKLNFLPPSSPKQKRSKTKGGSNFSAEITIQSFSNCLNSTLSCPLSTCFAYLIQLISQVHLLCRLISTIYFNKPPNSIWLTNWLFHLLVLLLLSALLFSVGTPVSVSVLAQPIAEGLKLLIFCSKWS